MDIYFVMIYKNYDRIHLKIVYIERNNISLTLYDSYVATILIVYNVMYAIISNQCGNFSPDMRFVILALFILTIDSRK